MKILNRREPFLLFVGDLVAFSVALWLSLALRYGALPSQELLLKHTIPFLIIFALWVAVFFIAGLYEKHTLVFKGNLPTLILNTQIANSIIAVIFFYLFASFGITPKTILATDLVISLGLIVFWRVSLVPRLGFRKRENALLVGVGEETTELRKEVNAREQYNFKFVSSISLNSADINSNIALCIRDEKITSVVVDFRNEKAEAFLPALYSLIPSGVHFYDIHKVYEEVFERIPLSLVRYSWFLENISSSSHAGYDTLKRAMDLIIGGVLGILSLPVYPFVALLVFLDDRGGAMIFQNRIGKKNSIIRIMKFRSMARGADGENKVTRAGRILRATRIDELPQLWNVVKGELSLVGPRPELPELVKIYEKEIPYYQVRHLVTPGLSGWGQIKDYNVPRGTADVDKTRTKLSYDLYYIKNRSFMLDLTIALKTLKTLLSQSGN